MARLVESCGDRRFPGPAIADRAASAGIPAAGGGGFPAPASDGPEISAFLPLGIWHDVCSLFPRHVHRRARDTRPERHAHPGVRGFCARLDFHRTDSALHAADTSVHARGVTHLPLPNRAHTDRPDSSAAVRATTHERVKRLADGPSPARPRCLRHDVHRDVGAGSAGSRSRSVQSTPAYLIVPRRRWHTHATRPRYTRPSMEIHHGRANHVRPCSRIARCARSGMKM
jgi:hypothetical protein